MLKKKFKSSITCIQFHPLNGQVLATGSTDFKCRIYSTHDNEVDGGIINPRPFVTPLDFGEVYIYIFVFVYVFRNIYIFIYICTYIY
jgi:WD40 repeat protein